MKTILYIITKPSLEDLASVISVNDSHDAHMRVLLVQNGVQCSPKISPSCMALQEDIQKRELNPSCPTVGYKEMVNLIFESDLVITI